MIYNLKRKYQEETGENPMVSVEVDDDYETYANDDYVNWLESFVWKLVTKEKP